MLKKVCARRCYAMSKFTSNQSMFRLRANKDVVSLRYFINDATGFVK